MSYEFKSKIEKWKSKKELTTYNNQSANKKIEIIAIARQRDYM